MLDVDATAKILARWGRHARGLPKDEFLRGGLTHPLTTSRGSKLGRIIPGHGLAIDADLKTLGITRKVPGVIERSTYMRVLEALSGDRAAITGMTDLVNLVDRQTYCYTDTFIQQNNTAAQQFDTNTSLTGFATCGTVAPTRLSLAGAWNTQMRNPTPGRKQYLMGVSSMSNVASGSAYAMGIYVDILSVFGNVAVDTVIAQTVNSAALTRYTTGAGVYYALASPFLPTFAWTTPPWPTLTVSYTNQAGTAGQLGAWSTDSSSSSQILTLFDVSATVPYATFQHAFQAGDYGIRSIQTTQLSIASATVGGKMGGFLYKPLWYMHGITESGQTPERDVRAEPECLVEMQTTVGGDSGYHSFIWIGNANINVTDVTFSFTVGEG